MIHSRASLAVAVILLSTGGSVLAAPTLNVPQAPVFNNPNGKLINLSASTQVFYKGENLRFTVLRAVAGNCTGDVRITIDGKSRVDKNPTFPWTFEVSPRDPIYPTKNARYEVIVDGLSPACAGRLTYTFAYNDSSRGVVTDVRMMGFTTPETEAVQILGHGVCRIRVATYRAPYDRLKSNQIDLVFLDAPVRLPYTVPLKRTGEEASQFGGDHVIEIYALGVKADGLPDDASKKTYPGYEGCTVVSNVGVIMLQKTFPTTKSNNASNGGGGNGNGGNGGGGTPGGGGGPMPSKPANGQLASMLVPGGSFAEDEAQKIQVKGAGGCAFDLTLSNKTYGGSTEKTYPVNPVKLDGAGAMLYNGTHFGTLAEGSWKASAVAKSGCTGNTTTDFKVTAKTSTKKVLGKPTIAFDVQPKAGGNTFVNSKDGNIWFKVTVPSSIKDEQYATCCDVEYDFINEYGGWEVMPNSPFTDAQYGNAVKQANAVGVRGVSYFSNATQWRMKVKGMKYKTEFEWSDWIEFKVDQK